MPVALLLLLVGHTFFWVCAVNLLHSTTMPYRLCKAITKAIFVAMGVAPAAVVAAFWSAGRSLLDPLPWLAMAWPLQLLAAFFALLGAVAGLDWIVRRALLRRPKALRSTLISVLDVSPRESDAEVRHHPLARLPLNEILQIEIAEKELELPGLGAALDGLSILHLSDLHYSGKVARQYFEEVVRLGNGMRPDLVAVTGDLIDRSQCIDWMPDTLGRLAAPLGVYFILGNHDARHDWKRLRCTLRDCGLIDMGGRWLTIEAAGQPVVLAGNELPWFPPAADLRDAPPPSRDGGPPRILLAHTPDQFPWARANAIDLMLAGHNHGGQIQLPLIGPVFSPSRYGVRYASGTFQRGPTVMHVSRGVSAQLPLRWNCRPELIKLTLRAASAAGDRRGGRPCQRLPDQCRSTRRDLPRAAGG